MQIEVSEALSPLLTPARYKGAYGGRGSGKSRFFGQLAVMTNYSRPARGVCIREVQNSIKDSVKQLVADEIQRLGLGSFFEVLRDEIRGQNGSLMVFKGMQSYNAENIKSLEDFDWAWVEEAQSLSAVSMRLLRPTIRKTGSELWFSWNPRHDSDAVDTLLRGPNKPKDATVVECNWKDNPWLPEVLLEEMRRDYEADPEEADHVWGGNYQIVSEGAYYAKLIAQAQKEGRIGFFPYDPKRKVMMAWDLGVDDATAIWFMQDIDGRHVNVIDYYEVSGEGAPDIVATALPEVFKAPPYEERFIGWDKAVALSEIDRTQPYSYSRHFLPHDIKAREWGAGARGRIETLAALGLDIGTIKKGAAVGPVERVNAVRRILPMCRFHHSPRVEKGLTRLRRYRRKWNDTLNSYTVPLHDESSHGSDAFGEFAVNCGITPPPPPVERKPIDTRMPTLNEIVEMNDLSGRSGRRI